MRNGGGCLKTSGSNLEQAFAIAGGSEDELAGLIIQISQVVAKQLKKG
jgi:hypothetical protein